MSLPCNLDAERSILAAILLNNACFRQTADYLRPDDFYLDSHRRIWGQICLLAKDGKPIDYVTLTEYLASNHELESIGGTAYLFSLTDGFPRLENIESYIRIVHEKAILRATVRVCGAVMASAMSQHPETLEMAQNAFAGLSERNRTADTGKLLVSADRFCRQVPGNIDWLVEGVIQCGANGFVVADPKAGKSWAVIDLAVALATGTPWLEFRVPQPTRVALVSREDHFALTGWRLNHLLAGRLGEDANWSGLAENLHVNTRQQTAQLMIDSDEQMAELRSAMIAKRIEFAIFDVFNVMHGAKENDPTEMRGILSRLSRLQAETGASCAVVHHFRKGEDGDIWSRMRGASSIAGFAEWAVGIKVTQPEARPMIRRMEFEGKAACPPEPFSFVIETEGEWSRLRRVECEQPQANNFNQLLRRRDS
jgi:hypothetical protein